MLLNLLLNNIPISLQGPLNFICKQVFRIRTIIRIFRIIHARNKISKLFIARCFLTNIEKNYNTISLSRHEHV